MDGPKPVERQCVEATCGKTFTIEPREQDFYVSKDMPLPKRCPECRERRRATINRQVRHAE
jgi:hypothetical protein